jgi:divalent metal cation (Fe/Co/Zn/Cd) transporter
LLTGLIVSLITIFGLPIDPAIATIIVLYVVKIGLNTFCEYTEPETDPKLPAAEDEKGK